MTAEQHVMVITALHSIGGHRDGMSGLQGQQPYRPNSWPAVGFQQHALADNGSSSRVSAIAAHCSGAPCAGGCPSCETAEQPVMLSAGQHYAHMAPGAQGGERMQCAPAAPVASV